MNYPCFENIKLAILCCPWKIPLQNTNECKSYHFTSQILLLERLIKKLGGKVYKYQVENDQAVIINGTVIMEQKKINICVLCQFTQEMWEKKYIHILESSTIISSLTPSHLWEQRGRYLQRGMRKWQVISTGYQEGSACTASWILIGSTQTSFLRLEKG